MPIMNMYDRVSLVVYHMQNSSIGHFSVHSYSMVLLIFHSGALGAGLVILSRFPIISSSIHPYSLNGEPIDVVAGDWFVGKAAASILIAHPVLGQVQIFNTHVSLPTPVLE